MATTPDPEKWLNDPGDMTDEEWAGSDELLGSMKRRGVRPDDLTNPVARARYEEWLKAHP